MPNDDVTVKAINKLLLSGDNGRKKNNRLKNQRALSIELCKSNKDELDALIDIGVLLKEVSVDTNKDICIKAIANSRYEHSLHKDKQQGFFNRILNNIGMKVLG